MYYKKIINDFLNSLGRLKVIYNTLLTSVAVF